MEIEKEPVREVAPQEAAPPSTLRILKKIKEGVNYVLLDGVICVRKIIKQPKHPWASLASYNRVFASAGALFRRLEHIYRRMDELGFGPRILRVDHFHNRLVIYMERMTNLPRGYARENTDLVRSVITRLHASGYVHADLHGGNVMLGADGLPRFVDFDVMFELSEKDTNPLVAEWIWDGFEKTFEEFIEYELNVNYLHGAEDE